MRVAGGIVGGIGIGAAVILLGLAALVGLSAVQMRNQVAHFSPVEKWANDWSGQSKKNESQIESTVLAAAVFGAGALFCGGVGAAFLIVTYVASGKLPFGARRQPDKATPATIVATPQPPNQNIGE